MKGSLVGQVTGKLYASTDHHEGTGHFEAEERVKERDREGQVEGQ